MYNIKYSCEWFIVSQRFYFANIVFIFIEEYLTVTSK